MKFNFDGYNKPQIPRVFLSYPNKKLICQLNAKNKKSEFLVVGISSFKFSIYQYHENVQNEGFDKISVGKYIWLEDNGWYRIKEINRVDEGNNPRLEVSCYDLAYELKQTYLTSFGSMGTEDDEQGGLDRYALYDAGDKSHSVAHIFMDKNPGWKFKYIDPAISKNRRSFDNDSVTSYDFLTGDVAETFECIFKFDSNDRSVSVFKVDNIGKQIPLIMSFRNLVKELNISWDENDIKTKLCVTGGNDASGTALSIASVNPSGNNYITNFSYFYEDMSAALKEKLEEYYQKMEDSKGLIATALSQLKTLQDELDSLNNKMPSNESSITWSEYGLVGLKAKASTYKEQMSVLTDKRNSDPVAQTQYNNYNTLWNAVNNEIVVRQTQITAKENQIKTKQTEAQSYVVKIDEVLGEDLYAELQPFAREDNLCDSSYIATSTMTESEILEMKQDLYNHGVEELNRVCYPQFDMEVKAINFPVLFKYKEYTDELELGDILVIKYSDDDFIRARLLVMEIDWENFKNFKLTFSSKSIVTGGLFIFADFFKMANRDNISLKYKTSGWNQASKQANEAYYNTNLKEFLDLSLQQIEANGKNQEILIDSTGLLLKKWLPDENKYAPEKLWITNRQILLFEEPDGTNLKEPKVAIGKISVEKNGTLHTGYGVGAELLIGKFIIGESLFIQNKNNTLTLDDNGFTASATNGYKVQINPDNPNEIFGISLNGNNLLYVDAVKNKLIFKGRAEIDEGLIGGWEIAANKLSSGNVGMSSDATAGAVAYWAGNTNPSIAPYRVNNLGEFVSSKADISGKITATSGQIGGYTIEGNILRGTSASYIIGGRININNGYFYAGDNEVYIGDFVNTYTNRSLFMSIDEYTGMSAKTSSNRFALWGGYNGGGFSDISNYVFAVSGVQVYAKELSITGDSWWENWTLTRTMKRVFERLDDLEAGMSRNP
ncbi:phage tail protein [Clostridium sp. HBUAS56010]|uniref:phage tail protein n=1 Tax=Clostridium sp. HBUAS56010 TaxID=2571127 RepID=UPI001177CD31|nr:phage tail protein [Clostridium sp. HBUAS56010]